MAGYLARRAERELVGVGWQAQEYAQRQGEGTQASRLLHEAGGIGGISYSHTPEGERSGGGSALGRSACEPDGDTDEDTYSDAERERALALLVPSAGDKKRAKSRRGARAAGAASVRGSSSSSSVVGGASLASLGGEGTVAGFGGSVSRPVTAEGGGGAATARSSAGGSYIGGRRGC